MGDRVDLCRHLQKAEESLFAKDRFCCRYTDSNVEAEKTAVDNNSL